MSNVNAAASLTIDTSETAKATAEAKHEFQESVTITVAMLVSTMYMVVTMWDGEITLARIGQTETQEFLDEHKAIVVPAANRLNKHMTQMEKLFSGGSIDVAHPDNQFLTNEGPYLIKFMETASAFEKKHGIQSHALGFFAGLLKTVAQTDESV